jgi:hypothetical protein
MDLICLVPGTGNRMIDAAGALTFKNGEFLEQRAEFLVFFERDNAKVVVDGIDGSTEPCFAMGLKDKPEAGINFSGIEIFGENIQEEVKIRFAQKGIFPF